MSRQVRELTPTSRWAGAAALLFVGAVAAALEVQKTTTLNAGTAGSPHVRTEWLVDGASIAIEYGRPSLKGRALKGFEWYGQEWRTGADQATTLKTDKTLKFGTLVVPPGTYSIYTLTGDQPWQLIVNKTLPSWGIPYPGSASDLGRAAMRMGTNATPVDLLTISIDDTPAGATLRIDWGTTRASIAFIAG
jgi:hypothetical protein